MRPVNILRRWQLNHGFTPFCMVKQCLLQKQFFIPKIKLSHLTMHQNEFIHHGVFITGLVVIWRRTFCFKSIFKTLFFQIVFGTNGYHHLRCSHLGKVDDLANWHPYTWISRAYRHIYLSINKICCMQSVTLQIYIWMHLYAWLYHPKGWKCSFTNLLTCLN